MFCIEYGSLEGSYADEPHEAPWCLPSTAATTTASTTMRHRWRFRPPIPSLVVTDALTATSFATALLPQNAADARLRDDQPAERRAMQVAARPAKGGARRPERGI